MHKKIKIVYLLTIFFAITSCESLSEVKRGLTGEKKTSTDEFLVKKKDPLIMPPDYEKLPKPGNQEVSPKTFSDNNDVKDLLNIEESDSNSKVDDDSSENIESAIIEKIQ